MHIRIGISVILMVLLQHATWSQAPEEILNLSQRGTYGSARVMGLSGAMNAIGADASLIPNNPATLGAFWKSEVNIGFVAEGVEVNSSLNGGPSSSASDNFFNLSQLSYVKTTVRPQSDLVSQSFAFGFQKLADFQHESSSSGFNQGSIAQYWMDRIPDGAIPEELDPFQEGLAFKTYVIDTVGGFYFTPYDETSERAGLDRFQLSLEEGYNNEFYLAYGANVKNKWMFGATLGIPFFRYQYRRDYVEDDVDDQVPIFDQLVYLEDLETTGVGVNLKLGTIYKVNDQVRLSAAVHTPTFYSLSDDFRTQIQHEATQGELIIETDETIYTITQAEDETFAERSPINNFDYSATSAWRGLLGMAYMFDGKGFIDAEVEYIGYQGSRYNLTSNDNSVQNQQNEDFVNQDIEALFRNAVNVRVGGELVLDKFRLRAGTRLLGSPYEDNSDFNTSYSFGLGYRGNRFYIDGAYVTSQQERNFQPYPPSEFQQLVNQEFNRNQFVFTLGYKI